VVVLRRGGAQRVVHGVINHRVDAVLVSTLRLWREALRQSGSRAAHEASLGQSLTPRLKLTLTAAAEAAVRGGHPWVFSDSIRTQSRPAQAGELAVLYDRQDQFLAVGLFDPDSPLRVRVLHAGRPATLDDAWWRERFAQRWRGAKASRMPDQRPAAHQRRERWLAGLVLDRYDQTLC